MNDERPMTVAAHPDVRLRPVHAGDLPRIFEIESDPESNRMAVVNPRDRISFDAHWTKLLADPSLVSNAILRDGELVGTIACFPMDGDLHVGYRIDRSYWGRGIATRALGLLLQEVTDRPLTSTVATSNTASQRVLRKHGFVMSEIRDDPATERYPACEVMVMILEPLQEHG